MKFKDHDKQKNGINKVLDLFPALVIAVSNGHR